jgi:hypothetical protein
MSAKASFWKIKCVLFGGWCRGRGTSFWLDWSQLLTRILTHIQVLIHFNGSFPLTPQKAFSMEKSEAPEEHWLQIAGSWLPGERRWGLKDDEDRESRKKLYLESQKATPSRQWPGLGFKFRTPAVDLFSGMQDCLLIKETVSKYVLP